MTTPYLSVCLTPSRLKLLNKFKVNLVQKYTRKYRKHIEFNVPNFT